MEQPTTTIDAVRLVRRIRDAHHEELRRASRADRIEFYNSKVRAQSSGGVPERETPAAGRPEDQ